MKNSSNFEKENEITYISQASILKLLLENLKLPETYQQASKTRAKGQLWFLLIFLSEAILVLCL